MVKEDLNSISHLKMSWREKLGDYESTASHSRHTEKCNNVSKSSLTGS